MFYFGSYQILADSLEPPTDSGPWALPDGFNEQHMSDTNNVEELFINVEDMDVVPTRIQFGSGEWTDDEGFTPDDSFAEFYVRDEAFYVRSFTSTDYFVEFYVKDEAFYVRSFSPTDSWAAFYIADGFYVRSFSPTDSWTPMFYQTGNFYVRSFTATDFWTSFYVPTN